MEGDETATSNEAAACESEISDETIVEIDESADDAAINCDDTNEEAKAVVPIRPGDDIEADCECEKETLDEGNVDCAPDCAQTSGETELVEESAEVIGFTTDDAKCNDGSVNVENAELEIEKTEVQSQELTEIDENWVVVDEVDDEDNSEKDGSHYYVVSAEEEDGNEEMQFPGGKISCSETFPKILNDTGFHDSDVKGDEMKNEDDRENSGNLVLQDEQNSNPYYCAVCNVHCEDNKSYFTHTRGMMHTLNSEASAEQSKPEMAKDSDQKSGGDGQGGEEKGDKCEPENCRESWLAFKRGENNTYYCEVCECSTNSLRNYENHVAGLRHQKNLKNRAIGAPIKKPKGKSAFGSQMAKVVSHEPKLLQMIQKCEEPLIGLQYVTEFCHVNPDFEPVYACNLCESKCDARMIKKHLTGFKHRFAYMKKHHVNYAVLTQNCARKSDQTAVAETYAGEIEAKEGRQKIVVKLETNYSNESGVEPADYDIVASAIAANYASERERDFRLSPHTRSISPRSDRSAGRREYRKRRRRSRGYDSPRRYKSSRHSRTPDRHGQRRDERSYYDRCDRHHDDYERRRRDFLDYHDRGYERDHRRPSLEHSSSVYQYPVHDPFSQAAGSGMSAGTSVPMGYAYPPTAPPTGVAPPPAVFGQFSEYRASISVTNPASFMPPHISNLIGYPAPHIPYGGPSGFQSIMPPPPKVPPVMPPRESAAASASSYCQIPFGANASTYGVANASVEDRNLLPFGSTTLSSVVSSVAANVMDDCDEAGAISKVIAEAILKYKLLKAQEKTANTRLPSNRF